MQSGHSATVQTLQSPKDDKRVEVSLESDGGTERVVLRYLTWTEGLGWCGQKTICLEGDQLDDLHRALTVARHRLHLQRAERGERAEPAQIIQLPALA